MEEVSFGLAVLAFLPPILAHIYNSGKHYKFGLVWLVLGFLMDGIIVAHLGAPAGGIVGIPFLCKVSEGYRWCCRVFGDPKKL